MTAYHLFTYRGVPFVFHVALGKFLAVSPAAYVYLQMRERFGRSEAEEKFRQQAGANDSVLNEVATLEETGFFDSVPAGTVDDAAFEAALDKRYAKGWSGLELSVSERCNLACRYCYCGTCRDEIPNSGLMSEETVHQAVEWIFSQSGSQNVRITFFGGEPLLGKAAIRTAIDLSQKLAAARGVDVSYSMTTNGTLLDDESIDWIKKYNFGLMVSLDGPKERHDAQCPTRDGSGSWDLAVAGIRRLMARRRQVTVRCTMAHPVPDMRELVAYFKNFGFTRVVLGEVCNPTFPSPCDFTEADFRDEERQLAEKIVPWMLAELADGRTPLYDPFADVEADLSCSDVPEPSPFRCGACRGTSTVGADGTLYPCHRFVGMRNWAVGSIGKGPDLERCRAFWRAYWACVKDSCAACWAYPLCKGPCPWAIARTDGTFALDEKICERTKRYLELAAWYLHLKRKSGFNKGGSK